MYKLGRRYEYRAIKLLEQFGYTCTRSASSQGLWDVVGVRFDEVKLVQVKFTSADKYYEDANCKEFRNLPVPDCVVKELWVFRPRRKPEIINMYGSKKKGDTANERVES